MSLPLGEERYAEGRMGSGGAAARQQQPASQMYYEAVASRTVASSAWRSSQA